MIAWQASSDSGRAGGALQGASAGETVFQLILR